MNRAKNIEPCFMFVAFLFFFSGCAAEQYKLYDERVVNEAELAELRVPSQLSLMTFNGDAPPLTSALMVGDKVSFKIGPGEHAVKLRYRNHWETRVGDYEVVQSLPLSKEFTARPGAIYEVTIEEPDTFRGAEQFAKNFDYKITEDFEGTVTVASRATFGGIKYQQKEKPVRYVQESKPAPVPERARYASKDAPMITREVPVEKAPVVAAPVVVQQPQPIEPNKQNATPESLKGEPSKDELLKFWWGRANDAEREKFKRWIGE